MTHPPPPVPSPVQPSTPLDASIVEVWKKYEDVAMHFNDLIMRWRLQAIGGLAGLVTLAGFVVGDAETLTVRYRVMLILSGVLTSDRPGAQRGPCGSNLEAG